MDLQEVGMDEKTTFFYGATLQKDPNLTLPCSWATADPSTFLIRGENYLQDQQKVIHFLDTHMCVCSTHDNDAWYYSNDR